MLPVLAAAASDQNVRRRALDDDSQPASHHYSPETIDDEITARHLTWGWRWYKSRNKKKFNQNRNKQPTSVGGLSIAADACDCQDQWTGFNFTAFIGNVLEPAPDGNQIGGQYIYNLQLYQNEALNEPYSDGDVTSVFLTGACSRFQSLEITTDGNRILGAGVCHFALSVVTSTASSSMIIQGELFDVIPSSLAVTGGTGDFDGASGEVTFTPFYDNGGADVFTEASRVELGVDARVLSDRFL
jgi:hypothetical protein